MKKLVTDIDGGFPFMLNDLRWMSEGIYEAISELVNPFIPPGQDAIILSGCEITSLGSSQYSITEGYIYLNLWGNYEICKFEAQTITVNSGQQLRFNIVNTYDSDPAGSKVFFNSANHNVYLNRKAQAISSSNTGYPALQEMQSIGGRWLELDHNCYYKYTPGQVHIKGTLGDGQTLTLPSGYRPAESCLIPVTIYGSDPLVYYTGHASIQTNGTITILGYESDDTAYLNFSFAL